MVVSYLCKIKFIPTSVLFLDIRSRPILKNRNEDQLIRKTRNYSGRASFLPKNAGFLCAIQSLLYWAGFRYNFFGSHSSKNEPTNPNNCLTAEVTRMRRYPCTSFWRWPSRLSRSARKDTSVEIHASRWTGCTMLRSTLILSSLHGV